MWIFQCDFEILTLSQRICSLWSKISIIGRYQYSHKQFDINQYMALNIHCYVVKAADTTGSVSRRQVIVWYLGIYWQIGTNLPSPTTGLALQSDAKLSMFINIALFSMVLHIHDFTTTINRKDFQPTCFTKVAMNLKNDCAIHFPLQSTQKIPCIR